MTVRIPWNRYEIALLFDAYERVAGGSDINSEAVKLSESLHTLATCKGIPIDETYRNVNGMTMQLANVQYLFTCGQKGCPVHRRQFVRCMNCTKLTTQSTK